MATQPYRRWMPIQVGSELALRKRRGERVCIVQRLPWELFEGEAIERQSDKNHGQSVAKIASRGGYGACEAIAVIACVPWQKFCEDEEHAHRILYAMHCIFNRGQRVAEAAHVLGESNAPSPPPIPEG